MWRWILLCNLDCRPKSVVPYQVLFFIGTEIKWTNNVRLLPLCRRMVIFVIEPKSSLLFACYDYAIYWEQCVPPLHVLYFLDQGPLRLVITYRANLAGLVRSVYEQTKFVIALLLHNRRFSPNQYPGSSELSTIQNLHCRLWVSNKLFATIIEKSICIIRGLCSHMAAENAATAISSTMDSNRAKRHNLV